MRSWLFILGDERAELSRWFAGAASMAVFDRVQPPVGADGSGGFERRTSQFIAKYQRTGHRQAGYGSRSELLATSPPARICEKFVIDIWANSSVQLDRICRCNWRYCYYHFLQPNQGMSLVQSRWGMPKSGWPSSLAMRSLKGDGRGYPFLIQKAEYLRSLGESYHDLTGIFCRTSGSSSISITAATTTRKVTRSAVMTRLLLAQILDD